mmetsp:Transcript_14452/g.45441  ORF Transcript_14452/g.45441 Transcript_14452/m.45441 type:complete len:266 (-) Transcript_14452:2323-3120(-)
MSDEASSSAPPVGSFRLVSTSLTTSSLDRSGTAAGAVDRRLSLFATADATRCTVGWTPFLFILDSSSMPSSLRALGESMLLDSLRANGSDEVSALTGGTDAVVDVASPVGDSSDRGDCFAVMSAMSCGSAPSSCKICEAGLCFTSTGADTTTLLRFFLDAAPATMARFRSSSSSIATCRFRSSSCLTCCSRSRCCFHTARAFSTSPTGSVWSVSCSCCGDGAPVASDRVWPPLRDTARSSKVSTSMTSPSSSSSDPSSSKWVAPS